MRNGLSTLLKGPKITSRSNTNQYYLTSYNWISETKNHKISQKEINRIQKNDLNIKAIP